jgi:hypothetical protein
VPQLSIGVFQADSGWWHARVDGLRGSPVAVERTQAEAVGRLLIDLAGRHGLPAVVERKPPELLELSDLDKPHPPPGYG